MGVARDEEIRIANLSGHIPPVVEPEDDAVLTNHLRCVQVVPGTTITYLFATTLILMAVLEKASQPFIYLILG